MGKAREAEMGLRQRRELGGLAGGLVAACLGWIRNRRTGEHELPRLALVERISLAPRQSLALVEAEGRRFLIAIPPEGSPVFLALDGETGQRGSTSSRGAARVSW